MLGCIEIVRDRTSKLLGAVPFVFMIMNTVGFAIAFYSFICECQPNETLQFIYDFNGQMCDVSLLCFVLMLGTSKSYSFLSWVSFICLCALWLLNALYICLSWSIDLYYSIASLIIYAIFVILTIRVLTNAKI